MVHGHWSGCRWVHQHNTAAPFPPVQWPLSRVDAGSNLHQVVHIKFISIKGHGGFLSAPIVISGHSHLSEYWDAAAILVDSLYQRISKIYWQRLLIFFCFCFKLVANTVAVIAWRVYIRSIAGTPSLHLTSVAITNSHQEDGLSLCWSAGSPIIDRLRLRRCCDGSQTLLQYNILEMFRTNARNWNRLFILEGSAQWYQCKPLLE